MEFVTPRGTHPAAQDLFLAVCQVLVCGGSTDAVEGQVAAAESNVSRGVVSGLGTAHPMMSLLKMCVQLTRLKLPSLPCVFVH